MIAYDSRDRWALITQMTGSIIPGSLLVGITLAFCGLALALMRVINVSRGADSPFQMVESKYIQDVFSGSIFSGAMGYLLVVRTNMALDRWMEGITEVQNMLAKWRNAYDSLNAFLVGKPGISPEQLQRIDIFRTRLGHWFAMMSCIAIATLRSGDDEIRGDAHMKLEEIPVNPRYPKRSGKASRTSMSVQNVDGDIDMTKTEMDAFGSGDMSTTKGVKLLNLSILHVPTPEEIEALDKSPDKVYTLFCWILQGIMIEIREGTLDCPPPLVTHFYSEISGGMLGFHQSLKLARVPFPFPFAQMVTCALTMFLLVLPFYVDVFSVNVMLTTICCFVVPMCYRGLNLVSVELESPFGVAANNVDIEERHEAFVDAIEDVLMLPMQPPRSSAGTLEKTILAEAMAARRSRGAAPVDDEPAAGSDD